MSQVPKLGNRACKLSSHTPLFPSPFFTKNYTPRSSAGTGSNPVPLRGLTSVLPLGLLLLASAFGSAAEITVAAAADLQFALRDIARSYQSRTGNTVKLTFGSSGALAAQIQNGAPFDLFFSADARYPEQLVEAHAALPDSLTRYARGVLVLWVARGQIVSGEVGGIARISLQTLLSPDIVRIALANPQHAPYGRAAVEAMRKAGIYDQVKGKFVLGENVSQAAQFAESGNVQAAFLPLALASAPGLKEKGQSWRVPAELYAPIIQTAAVSSHARDPKLARDFLTYVTTEGMPVLRSYGFEPVEPKPSVTGERP